MSLRIMRIHQYFIITTKEATKLIVHTRMFADNKLFAAFPDPGAMDDLKNEELKGTEIPP